MQTMSLSCLFFGTCWEAGRSKSSELSEALSTLGSVFRGIGTKGSRKKSSPIPSGAGRGVIKENTNPSSFLKPQAARNKTGGSDH